MRTESKIDGYRENLEGSTSDRNREEMTEQLLRRSCLVLPTHLSRQSNSNSDSGERSARTMGETRPRSSRLDTKSHTMSDG